MLNLVIVSVTAMINDTLSTAAMLSVVMLSAVLLIIAATFSKVMLSVLMLSGIMLNATIPSAFFIDYRSSNA